MARGTMHAPKAGEARRRRNAPSHAETRLVRDDEVRGPELADLAGTPETPVPGWLPQVVAWWDTWRRSPQAQTFEATDWMRLATLAPIVQNYWRRPSAAALGEIRMNEERLGATVVDRMRARMRIEDPEPEGDGDGVVVSIKSASRADVAARLKAGE